MMAGGKAATAEALVAEKEALRLKNDQEWQFFDTARINVKAGMGGNGCVATRREKGISMGGPNGGSGGRGGSIFLRCSEGLNTLAAVRHKVHYRATNGQNGQGKSRTGNSGSDVYISAPLGTVVRDQDGSLCGELTHHGQELLIARGGRGGRGNEAFKTSRAKIPMFGEKGEPGGERWLSLELKLVADVGFVGVPNAGKSTLLAVSSNAKPKIADYPFTTVTPNLGVCDVLGEEDQAAGMEKGLVLADIPGLLEGAHNGVGLGLAFLRHVQRCRALVHVVSGDSVDPVGDYRAIQQELRLFSPKLLEKQQVVVLNKIDLPHVRSKQEELEVMIKAELDHTRFMSISAVAGENTKDLMRRLRKLVNALPPVDDLFDGEEVKVLDSPAAEDTGFDIETDPSYPGQFRVTGARIVQIARMTEWDYYEAVQRFQRVMEAMGVDAALRKAGAEAGDLIMIDEWDFDYKPDLSSVYLQGLDNVWEGDDEEDGDWVETASAFE
eukprot:g9426.t1